MRFSTYVKTSRLHAEARECKVLQEIIVQIDVIICTLRMYCHLFSGIGFNQITRPERRFASSNACAALGKSIVLVSDKISNVVDGFNTAGFIVQSFFNAVPKSVPRPYKPDSLTYPRNRSIFCRLKMSASWRSSENKKVRELSDI